MATTEEEFNLYKNFLEVDHKSIRYFNTFENYYEFIRKFRPKSVIYNIEGIKGRCESIDKSGTKFCISLIGPNIENFIELRQVFQHEIGHYVSLLFSPLINKKLYNLTDVLFGKENCRIATRAKTIYLSRPTTEQKEEEQVPCYIEALSIERGFEFINSIETEKEAIITAKYLLLQKEISIDEYEKLVQSLFYILCFNSYHNEFMGISNINLLEG